MDHDEERRAKEHFVSLTFVTDTMVGIQEHCVCGKHLEHERVTQEVFDYLPGKRFFTCPDYINDGLHYRQPWVCGVEEEIGFLKTHLQKAEKYNKELWEELEKLKIRVAELQ